MSDKTMTDRMDLESNRFPGWLPENGTSRYGYPYPPDMADMPASEIRQWGRNALDVRGEVDTDAGSGQVDHNWVIDATTWANQVLDLVSERLGPDDPE